MIINGISLWERAPIKDMVDHKVQAEPCSWGLTECGYDIRIKQDIIFFNNVDINGYIKPTTYLIDGEPGKGNFLLGSSIEYFQMSMNLMGQVLNKSTWARLGLDASMTTNIEPGWRGHLTLELTYHGNTKLHIPAGSGIAQVMFHEILEPRQYHGKYQDQIDKPVMAEIGPVCIVDENGVYPERLDVFVQEQCNHWWTLDYMDNTYLCKKCGSRKSEKP